MNKPPIEENRPQKIEDLFLNETLKEILEKMDNVPHLLLYGPPGVGKTTTALCICNKILGNSIKTNKLELNASDDRGISTVRNSIRQFAASKGLNLNGKKPKFIILDEADSMTKDAQMALRRVIEQYSEHTRFIFICNNIHKILHAIQSRCCVINYKKLTKNIIFKFIENYNSDLDYERKNIIYNLCNGDLRQCFNYTMSDTDYNFYKIDKNTIKLFLNTKNDKDISNLEKYFKYQNYYFLKFLELYIDYLINNNYITYKIFEYTDKLIYNLVNYDNLIFPLCYFIKIHNKYIKL